nr:transposon Ty3-G Gag-Pol polyprotein [Tanacetum cinerariifolium]
MKENANHHRRDLEFKEFSELKEVPEPLEIPSDPQPEKFLEERVITKGKYRPTTKVLIKWVGQPLGAATWENKRRFFKTYPAFRVEDNTGLSGVDCYVALDPTHAHRVSHTEGGIESDASCQP